MLLSPLNEARANTIFARCIALVASLPSLAGFVVKSLLAVLLCQLASTEREVLGIMAALGTSLGPYANTWVCKVEGTTELLS